MAEPDDHFDDEPDFYDELEEAEMNCGQTSRGGCDLAGTEWCDWSCPFSAELYRRRGRKIDKHQPDLFADGTPHDG